MLRTAPYEFRAQLMAGQARYDDPKVKAVFAHWADLIQKGYVNPDANDLSWDQGANERVFRGQAAMTLMGTWNIGYFTNAAHQWVAGQDFDFFPFPVMTPGLPLVALGPIDGLVLPKKATNPDGAKQVMAYLAGVEPQQAFSRGLGAGAQPAGAAGFLQRHPAACASRSQPQPPLRLQLRPGDTARGG